jgi:hypothetical protein
MAKLPSGLQFSLLELLALILIAGLGAAAMKSGGVLLALLLQSAIWSFGAAAVVAIFARKSWQAFAIGSLIGFAVYVGPVLYVGESELDPHEKTLPLTQPLLAVFAAMGAEAFVYEPTGEKFNAFTTDVTPSTDYTVNMSPQNFYTLSDGRVVAFREDPPRLEFMLAAHSLLAIACGYAFGKIAAVVYRRRTEAPQPTNS